MRLFYYYVAFLMLLICGCTSQSTRSIKKPSQLSKKLNPNHQIYHVLGDTSYILSHINTSQLLYIRKNQTATFTAKFEIEIILFENNRAIDTFWTTYSDADNNQIPKIIFTKTPINVYDDQILDIEINTKDLAKKNSHTITLKTNKNHLESNLFYLVSNAKTHLPITQYFIHPNDEIEISSQSFNTPLNINFYQTNFDVAAAPYTSNINSPLKFESESLTLVNQKDSVWTFKVPITSGIVKISPTENYSLPLSLIVLPAGFPKVKRYPHMIEVMRYITTNHEFNELKNASDQRAVFEEFWLKCGRNKEKAKNLIQQFYFRVEEANTFFTSYKEGWKTDRGIIYVVYGKPHQIYHNNNSETWLYGDETNPLSLNFTFYKQTNPYSDNDYELQRSPTYQSSWYVAIERWRDGRIYN